MSTRRHSYISYHHSRHARTISTASTPGRPNSTPCNDTLVGYTHRDACYHSMFPLCSKYNIVRTTQRCVGISNGSYWAFPSLALAYRTRKHQSRNVPRGWRLHTLRDTRYDIWKFEKTTEHWVRTRFGCCTYLSFCPKEMIAPLKETTTLGASHWLNQIHWYLLIRYEMFTGTWIGGRFIPIPSSAPFHSL